MKEQMIGQGCEPGDDQLEVGEMRWLVRGEQAYDEGPFHPILRQVRLDSISPGGQIYRWVILDDSGEAFKTKACRPNDQPKRTPDQAISAFQRQCLVVFDVLNVAMLDDRVRLILEAEALRTMQNGSKGQGE